MQKLTTAKVLGTAFNIIVGREKKKHSHGDATREVFETVVFVAILVLMLKLFVAEAFVIPTGSMASTLWGDQIKAECPECGYKFAVTASSSHGAERTRPRETFCQNCGASFSPKNPDDYSSGDRVLVGKYAYHINEPQRFDVPVFKYPEAPYSEREKTAMNFIKRLIGLPGETIAILHGDLFATKNLTYPNRPRPERKEDLWMGDPRLGEDYRYTDDPEAIASFANGGFDIIRKSPDEILAMRKLVFDLDRQPKNLAGDHKTRWQLMPDNPTGWTMQEKGFNHTGAALGWMRYQHVQAGSWSHTPYAKGPATPLQPAYIVDFLSYNVTTDIDAPQRTRADLKDVPPADVQLYGSHNWISDLIVECRANFTADDATLILELNKGADKFQAHFGSGLCKLYRIASRTPEKLELLAEQPTKIKAGGKFDLRFANVDCRLTVWVDGRALPFGNGADYAPILSEKSEPTTTDLHEPARIGATGNVELSAVQMWRDIHYVVPSPDSFAAVRANRNSWNQLQTYYVQPGHYLCLGDNSSQSDDGRRWGLVPERLMLGKAVTVYWPISRIGVIK